MMEQQAVFLKNHLISLVIFSILVCLAPAKGYSAVERGRRTVLSFGAMITSETGRSALDYNGYGCWCGFGGSGDPVDATDRCCKVHDECYSNVNCLIHAGLISYDYSLNPITCNANSNNQCQQDTCLCDKVAAECFGANVATYNDNYKGWPSQNCNAGSSNQTQDPHFVTFDGAKMTYEGDCRFLLAKPDDSFVGDLESFDITVLNANDRRGVAYHDDVTITLANHNATMTVRGELFVDGKPRAIPFIGGPFTVTKQIYKSIFAGGPKSILNDPILHLSTPLKINVSSSVPHADGQGTHYLRIDIPAAYRGKLTGMGGNFNGDPNDDYKLSDGTDIRGITPDTFRSQMIANSWVVKNHPDNAKFPCKTN